MNIVEVKKELERLQSENAKLKAKSNRKLQVRISAKGAISVYGLNSRFPVTLYANQWLKLLTIAEDIKSFIDSNRENLATRDE